MGGGASLQEQIAQHPKKESVEKYLPQLIKLREMGSNDLELELSILSSLKESDLERFFVNDVETVLKIQPDAPIHEVMKFLSRVNFNDYTRDTVIKNLSLLKEKEATSVSKENIIQKMQDLLNQILAERHKEGEKLRKSNPVLYNMLYGKYF